MTIRVKFLLNDIVESIEQTLMSLFKWFQHHILKGNADKYHFLVSTECKRSYLKKQQIRKTSMS